MKGENKSPAQKKLVHDYMVRFGAITPMDAIKEFGVMRLAARINELERDGVPINRYWNHGTNRLGRPTKWMVYSISQA